MNCPDCGRELEGPKNGKYECLNPKCGVIEVEFYSRSQEVYKIKRDSRGKI